MGEVVKRKKSMGLFAMVMFLSCTLLNTDLISSNTAVGTSIVFWWLIVGIFNLIPTAYIVRELTFAFPKEGGLYYWVSEGLGEKWGARVAWLYWAIILFFPPSSFIMAADLLCMAFFPQAGYLVRVIISVGLLWISIWISTKPMAESKVVFNSMGMINIIVYVMVFLVGIIYVATGHAAANDLSFHSLLPKLDQAMVFVPVIMFCSSGLEATSQSIEDSINPKRDLMRAMVLNIILLVGCNSLASIGVLMVMPLSDMSIMSGIADIFHIAFNSQFFYVLTILFVVCGIFGQICSWLITSARGVAESAKQGVFPAYFGHETKAGLPDHAIIINGIFSTVVIIIYAFVANTASDMFFALIGSSAFINFIPFILMTHSFVVMKFGKNGKLKDNKECPTPMPLIMAIALQITNIGVTMLLVWIPGVGLTSNWLLLVVSGVLTILVGELLIGYQKRVRAKALTSGHQLE